MPNETIIAKETEKQQQAMHPLLCFVRPSMLYRTCPSTNQCHQDWSSKGGIHKFTCFY